MKDKSPTVVPETLYIEEEEGDSPRQMNIQHHEQELAGDSSPDENVGVLSASSPSEDATQFQELVNRTVTILNIPSVAVEEAPHPVPDILDTTSSNKVYSCPILEGLWQPGISVWNNLSPSQPLSL